MKCTNKQCEHRWYCKNYELMPEGHWQDYVDYFSTCNALTNFMYLEVDEFLKGLYETGKSFRKLFPSIYKRLLKEAGIIL